MEFPNCGNPEFAIPIFGKQVSQVLVWHLAGPGTRGPFSSALHGKTAERIERIQIFRPYIPAPPISPAMPMPAMAMAATSPVMIQAQQMKNGMSTAIVALSPEIS